jgi:predicted ribosome quality control (RQC) complex YloA/Tae2 family protein
MRVNQVYDIDNKTYLIRLNRNEEKDVLLLESGNRLHKTSFEWPKSVAPSGFTMKLRKHLKNKRLEKLTQLGVDRIVHLQFGTNEATYHVILELYDRGNIILCDYEWTILNVLRPHIEGEELRFAVREKYPLDRARPDTGPPSMDELRTILSKARPGDTLRTVLNPVLAYGPSVIDHVLFKYGLNNCKIGGELPEEEEGSGQKKKNRKKNKENSQSTKVFDMDSDFTSLINAVNDGEKMLRQALTATSKGYLLQKREVRPNPGSDGDKYYYTNVEYHPFLSEMNKNEPFKEFGTFTEAVDEFYSSMESQKIDLKSFQQEREALKKLSNVKTDHAKRLTDLSKAQVGDRKKGEKKI